MDSAYYRFHCLVEYKGDFDYFPKSPKVLKFLREECKKFSYKIFDFGRLNMTVSLKFSLKEKEYIELLRLKLISLFDDLDKEYLEIEIVYPHPHYKWRDWRIEDVMPGAFLGCSPVFTNADMDLVYPSYPWQQEIIDMIEDEKPDDRSIILICDREGKKGKSTLVKFLVARKMACVLPWTGSLNQLNEYASKFPNYPAYILDLPRSLDKSDTQMFTSISVTAEQIKSGLVIPSMYGGSEPVIFKNSPWVFIFTNWPFPNVEKHFSSDRIKQFFLDDVQKPLQILDRLI